MATSSGPAGTFSIRLRKWLPYFLFGLLFVAAAAWGLFHFQSSPAGIADFPIAPGEELGIYVSGQTPEFETMWKAAEDGDLFSPFDHHAEGFTGSSHIQAWIRLPLTNPHDEERTYVLQVSYPWINLATLYSPDGSGGYIVQQQGKVRHYSAAKSDPLAPAFEFTLAPRESRILLLKLQDTYWLQPSLTLWDSPERFHQRALAVNRFIHTYLGLMAGLFVANLCALIAFRYKDLAYYLLFLVTTSALHCSNFNLFTVYRPDWIPSDFFLMDPTFDFARFDGLLLINSALLLFFTNEFLKLRIFAPRIERLVVAFAGLFLALGPLVMFGPLGLAGHSLRMPVAILWNGSNLVALFLGIFAWGRGAHQARFFVPALLLLFAVSVRFIWSSVTNQVVDSEVLQQWVYASSLEMIVFSVALIDRFLALVKEKQEAQAMALTEARNHAELQQRFNRDLTTTVEKQTRDLNAALRQKNRLIVYLAHDMRTPLTGLVSLSSMLARSPAKISPDEMHAYAAEIEGSARGVSELMENLLAWARLQTGHLKVQKQEYLVDDLLEATLPAVRTQALLKEIRLVFQPAPNCFVCCDFLAIATVLRNLLSNAIKFSPSGSAVTIHVENEGDQVQITVENKGAGLDEKQVERIHSGNPLNKTGGAHKASGAGLGLSICRDLLAIHQSRLRVSSKPNAGARFSFFLHRA